MISTVVQYWWLKMEIISVVNDFRHHCAAEIPASEICGDALSLHNQVIILIQTLRLPVSCLFALCPNQYQKRSVSSPPSLWSFPSLNDTVSEDGCFQTWTTLSPHLPMVTQNRAFSPGMCSHQQADLVAAPAATSGGQYLESKQTCSNLTPMDTLAGFRLTRPFPSQEHVTLLKARPDWRSVWMGVWRKEQKNDIWLERNEENRHKIQLVTLVNITEPFYTCTAIHGWDDWRLSIHDPILLNYNLLFVKVLFSLFFIFQI